MSAERQAFEAFAAKFCGVPYADLVRGETTGLVFAWECWQEAQREGGRWTDRRAEQLRDLSGLLRDCNDLDAASCVLARLRRIIAAADRLTTSSMEHIEPSFIEFIESLCRDDRRNQSNQEK